MTRGSRTAGVLLAMAALAGSATALAAAPSSAITARQTQTAQFRIKIEAATHTPKANAKWPVTIIVTTRSGKPLPGRLTMRILVGGAQVGTVDNGRVYRLIGSWHEKAGHEITWPSAAIGEPVTFQAVVTVHGTTRKANYKITVRA